jgi:hypothetical protein
MAAEERSKGFEVRDRRRFTETGEPRETAEDSEEGGAAAASEPPPEPEDTEPLPITLSTFLVSLSTQALVLLGEIPNPVTGKIETDLRGVREIIDLIALLKEKTRGNVDPGETQLFDKILFDLRMRYVEKVRT